MSEWVHRTMIIAAENYGLADALASAVASPGGVGMWTRQLAPASAGPATRLISSGQIDSQFAGLLPLTTVTVDPATGAHSDSTAPGQPEAIQALAAQNGMTVLLADIQALLDSSDVTDPTQIDPLTRMAQLGVVFVQVPML